MKVARNKKSILLECLMIFAKYSDEQNPVSTKKLMQYLEEDYGHQATRQVLAEDLRILESLGFKLGNDRRHYYLIRPISPEEVKAICHSVLADNTISRSYAEELIERLKSLQSIHFGEDSPIDLHMTNTDKPESSDIYDNIVKISKAITAKRIISFDYCHYNIDGELVKYRNRRFRALPCRTIVKNDRFYMITYDPKNDSYRHFRIDKIKDIETLGRHNVEVDFDPYEYTEDRLYMETGDIIDCTLRINGAVMDEVFELFGKDTRVVRTSDKDIYFAYVKAPAQALVRFASQHIKDVEVASPLAVREAVKELFHEAFEKYI